MFVEFAYAMCSTQICAVRCEYERTWIDWQAFPCLFSSIFFGFSVLVFVSRSQQPPHIILNDITRLHSIITCNNTIKTHTHTQHPI